MTVDPLPDITQAAPWQGVMMLGDWLPSFPQTMQSTSQLQAVLWERPCGSDPSSMRSAQRLCAMLLGALPGALPGGLVLPSADSSMTIDNCWLCCLAGCLERAGISAAARLYGAGAEAGLCHSHGGAGECLHGKGAGIRHSELIGPWI